MTSLTDILFSEVNTILTCLFLLLIIYWIATMFSGIDFDLDMDIDLDVDIEADANVDTAISAEGSNMDFNDISNAELNKEDVVGKRIQPLKWWQIVLIYFNFVGLPFMFTFTCFVFLWWFTTVLATALTYSYNNVFGFGIMIIAFVTSLFATKIFTTPFKGFFKNLNKDGDRAVDFIGRQGVLLSSISGKKMGNAELSVNGNSYSVYVKALNGETLNYQDKILIIKQSEDKNYFFVQSYNQ
ncbi:DUF1449 family protein [Robertkochia sediminum]|uniref:DUF1449 family protein n=1 Tax=Robertkochia sediminum TaxID=2785326 RepID=UPI0019332416|nr:DUF1449 family protein [Robertkochia sediminum]MBL7471181.1 DUF1449 family protein [Robertkochia sediminum]